MILLTVPHTGTVFTRYVLAELGLIDVRTDPDGHYKSHHTYEFTAPPDGPVITPLRDPMLAEISRINRGWPGYNIEEWDIIPMDAHFFRVPDGDVGALAHFVHAFRATPIFIDLTKKNSRDDTTGLKKRYLAGDVPDELLTPFYWLMQSERTRDIFDSQGYDLPWM